MMAGIGNINLKVMLLDTDFYALNAVNSYLAWDRRTRVTSMIENPQAMWQIIEQTPVAELPDVVIFDIMHLDEAESLAMEIRRLRDVIDGVNVICLSQHVRMDMIEAAATAGAKAYLLKHEVGLQIAWAIVYALDYDFVITRGVTEAVANGHLTSGRLFRAQILPEPREYPELTHRIRQAITLCVVEGMPAHLAADEMGISLHTIRGYVKDGYRILESYDETEYPVDMTPQERAFMRITALEVDS